MKKIKTLLAVSSLAALLVTGVAISDVDDSQTARDPGVVGLSIDVAQADTGITIQKDPGVVGL